MPYSPTMKSAIGESDLKCPICKSEAIDSHKELDYSALHVKRLDCAHDKYCKACDTKVRLKKISTSKHHYVYHCSKCGRLLY
jgi:hypothetical protein